MSLAIGACGSAEPKPRTGTYGCIDRPGRGVVARADRLVAGSVELTSYEPVRIGRDVDWALDPFDDSWQFALHSMQYVYDLLEASDRTGRSAYERRAKALLRDWGNDNVPQSRATFAWHPHATSKRTQVVACAAARWKERWIRDLLAAHGAFLDDAKNYEGAWNHGLDENLGLLASGCFLERSDWVRTAGERVGSALETMVDPEGVTNEQAVGYHYYDWVLFGRLIDSLELCGQDLPAAVRRAEKIPTFLAHATRPDGMWEGIGDSYVERAKELGARTPEERLKVYRGGWVFGRTGWGETGRFSDESFYSLRFGPSRRIHGHRDHTSLTYFTKGREIITEAGFSGYDHTPFRSYEQSESAHNVVVASDAGNFRWDEPTQLRQWCTGDGWQRFDLSGRPYTGVERTRTVLFIERPEVFVIRDVLSARKTVSAQQLWHLPPDVRVTPTPGRVTASAGETTAHLVQVLPHDNIDVVTGRDDPIQGWVAVGRAERVPAPVMITTKRGSRARFVTVIGVGKTLGAERSGSSIVVRLDGLTRRVELGDGTVVPAGERGRCHAG